MDLKLLLSLLLVVWNTSAFGVYDNVELDEYEEDATVPQTCAHDGFYGNSSCVCTADFGGTTCSARKCTNFGLLATDLMSVDKCLCPPIFTGRNCEPVKCVESSTSVLNTPDDQKAISLFVTYNELMIAGWNDNNVELFEILCSYNTTFRQFIFAIDARNPTTNLPSSNASSCLAITTQDAKFGKDDCGTEEVDIENNICQTIDISDVLLSLQKTPPHSIFFIATNVNVSSVDPVISKQIIATAISRQIQINVVVYPNILLTVNYDTDPGFQYLRNIAVSSLGNFISLASYENNHQNQIIKLLADNWINGYKVSGAVIKPKLPFSSNAEIYIAGEVNSGEDLIITANSSPGEAVNGTTSWKLYKIPAGQYMLEITGNKNGTIPLIYSNDGVRAYTAFVSDNLIDASFPINFVGAPYNLVTRFENNEKALSTGDLLPTVFISDESILSVENTPTDRKYCQFNIAYSVQCKKAGNVIVEAFTSRNSIVFPVYCADISEAETYFTNLEITEEPLSFDVKKHYVIEDSCPSNNLGVEQFSGRSFVLIFENTKDSNSSVSSVDNILYNENSIVYQLSDYILSGEVHYSEYGAILYNTTESENNYQKINEFEYKYFLTKVMEQSDKATSHQGYPVDVVKLLQKELPSVQPFSDVLFVINSNISDVNDEDKAEIYKLTNQRRVKLFFLIVQTYVPQFPNAAFDILNDFSLRSGGVAIRLNDYQQLQQFFSIYFPNLVANDIVAKAWSENPKPGILFKNIYLNGSEFLLVTNQNQANDGIVNATVTIGSKEMELVKILGELQIFKISVSSPGDFYSIAIQFNTDSLASKISLVLLAETGDKNFVNLAFVNGVTIRNDIEFDAGYFTPIAYSAFDMNPSISRIDITYSDDINPFKVVYGSSPLVNSTCPTPFDTTSNFDWVCSASNGLYHVMITAVGKLGTNRTRTFPLTCVGSTSKCLNGGEENDGNCICTLSWTGDICETPICQNGGTVSPGNTCNCIKSFSGDFCEKTSNNCSVTALKPDYRSDLSSLIFVADTRSLNTVFLTSGHELPGIPITVVLYGDNQTARVALTTTNGNLLPSVLGKSSAISGDPASNLYDAILLALKSQITDRALIIVLTSDPNEPLNTDIVSLLAAQRAEIRLITTSEDIGPNAVSLALLGNGIPAALSSADNFKTYFEKYIVPVFEQSNSLKTFNVFESAVFKESIQVIIPATNDGSDDNILLVHILNGKVNGSTPSPNLLLTDSLLSYNIYSLEPSTAENATLTISLENQELKAFYSIERISYLKTSYIFGDEINPQAGAVLQASNKMSIYTEPQQTLSDSDPSTMPYARIREITNGTGLGDSQTISFTRNSESCLYPYLAVLPICTNSSIGYQIQLVTKSSINEERQQQFVLTCHQPYDQNNVTNCGGNGSPNVTLEKCVCDNGWYGVDCKLPQCLNGGTRDGTVCRCIPPYYGQLCKDTDVQITSTTTPFTTYTSTLGTGSTATPELTSTLTPELGSTSTPALASTITSELGSTPTPELPSTSTPVTSTLNTATTVTPEPSRVVAFVIDLVGADDYAFNETISTILNYVQAFQNEPVYTLLTDNLRKLSFTFQVYTAESLATRLSYYISQRNSIVTADLTKALQYVADSFAANQTHFQNPLSINVFYLTQIGLAPNDDPTTVLSGLTRFDKTSVIISPFLKPASQDVIDSLKPFSDDSFKNVQDNYNAVNFMINATKNNENAIRPNKLGRSCAYYGQFNVMVGIDRSNPGNDTTMDSNLQNFLYLFRNGFNYIANDENHCTELPSFYNERTAFSAFIFYDQYYYVASYCPSSYVRFMNYSINGVDPAPDFQTKGIIPRIGTLINKNSCACNRFDDTNTTKLVVWLPRASVDGNATDVASLKINTTNAAHFVVPFYDITLNAENDLYYKLIQTQDNPDNYLLPQVKDGSVEAVVDELLNRVCTFRGIDPTSIPQTVFSDGVSGKYFDFDFN